MLRIGVDSFIWSELFSEKDLWIIENAKRLGFATIDFAIADPFKFPTDAVKKEVDRVGIEVVTSTTISKNANPISPDPAVRANGLKTIKKLVDVNKQLGSNILSGVHYAAWGYLSGRPRTEQEWEWSVNVMREAAQYAKDTSNVQICCEAVNRFETHFLNIAEDAVQYCKDVGTGNVKVHLDSFHMIREEKSFTSAVNTCGKEYLGYVHVCESDRGIPGTAMVPFKEFLTALKNVGYDGPITIESFDPNFVELAAGCAIWRKLAPSGEYLAVEGRKYLQTILDEIY